MATWTAHIYANFLLRLLNKGIDWDTDTHKLTLHTSSYTPNYATHVYQSDLSNEVANGNGYTTGGVTLTSVSTVLSASSALTAWAAATAMQVGEVRRKVSDNGHVYQVVAITGTGLTHATTEPTWPTTPGGTVVDNQVTWAEVGSHVAQLKASIPALPNSTFVTRYGVIADTTPGAAASNPLELCLDFGQDLSPNAAALTLTPSADGLIVIPIRAT